MAGARGAVVAWWDSHVLAFGVVAGEEKGRVVAVIAGGREVRVPKGRSFYEVELPGAPPGTGTESRRAAGERAEAARERAERRGGEVEIPTLWELTRERAGPIDEAELAGLALSDASAPARAALALALSDEGIHFQRRQDAWEPRSLQVVEAILKQRAREADRQRERRDALDAFARTGAGEPFVATGTETERKFLSALETVAIREDEVSPSVRRIAEEALESSGLSWATPAEGAFQLLRRTGRFASDDENLPILRHDIRVGFPPEVNEAASGRAAEGFAREGREDATALDVITVDGPHTREIDDGLSVEALEDGGWRVGVHIADPSAFVRCGGEVDLEARLRATSYYFPDRRVPMLPPEISERAASLVPGEERPALSVFADVAADGEIASYRMAATIVRPRERLDYDAAERSLDSGDGPWAESLRLLADVAAVRERHREQAGAISVRAPEAEIHVDASGRPVLERRDPSTPAHRLVAEAMILAGALAARFGRDAGVPLLYRRQPAPHRVPDPAAPDEHSLVAARRIRRGLRRGEVGLEPGPHHGLGLDLYAQATSPLRRYQDLTNHRQILAALRGERPPLDAAGLLDVAADCDRAEATGRKAERAQDRYWTLRWLEDRAPFEVEAVVVETEPRPFVVLVETLLEQPAPFLEGAVLGARVRLRVEEVRPRADLLVLRPV